MSHVLNPIKRYSGSKILAAYRFRQRKSRQRRDIALDRYNYITRLENNLFIFKTMTFSLVALLGLVVWTGLRMMLGVHS